MNIERERYWKQHNAKLQELGAIRLAKPKFSVAYDINIAGYNFNGYTRRDRDKGDIDTSISISALRNSGKAFHFTNYPVTDYLSLPYIDLSKLHKSHDSDDTSSETTKYSVHYEHYRSGKTFKAGIELTEDEAQLVEHFFQVVQDNHEEMYTLLCAYDNTLTMLDIIEDG